MYIVPNQMYNVMETTFIKSPPRTMMEVYKSLPEGTLIQLIENNLIMTPAPSYSHQDVQSNIIKSIFLFLHENDMGKLVVAPLDVYLDEENVFQPDIMFISKSNFDIIQKDGLHGSPDMIIELSSPASAKYDLHQKKNVYERSGVKEYWIVDPENKVAQGYFLKKGGYRKPLWEKGTIRSQILDHEIRF